MKSLCSFMLQLAPLLHNLQTVHVLVSSSSWWQSKTTSYLEHLDLAACRVQVFCVFTIFILLKGVDLHPERNPLLSSMFPWSKFCADTMYLARQKLCLSLETVWSCAKLSLDSLNLQCALTRGFSYSLETKRVRRVQNIFHFCSPRQNN